MLKPLIDESGHKPQSTENFIDAIKTKQIPDEQKLASFDVKSMFTSIPLQLATDYIDNATTVELPLPTDDIMDLLNFCLTSTYFQYNGKHYKQLPGGSYVLAEFFLWKTPRNKPQLLLIREIYLFGYATMTTLSPPYQQRQKIRFLRTP